MKRVKEFEMETTTLQGSARVPKHVLKAIEQVVTFYWKDELHHYVGIPKEERKAPHIFQQLAKVNRWLSRVNEVKSKI